MENFVKFFRGIMLLNLFFDEKPDDKPFLRWKQRPVYSKFWTSVDVPQEKPGDCFPILLKYESGQFVSPSTDFEPVPFFDEESKINFRANYCTDFNYEFIENEWYYFFFKPNEINRAGVEIHRKPGCNHWNAMKMRFEPEGVVIDNSLDYEKYFAIEEEIFPICYEFDYETDTFSSCKSSGLPTFTIDEITSSNCFSRHFENHPSKWDWNEYTLFIYFTSSELRDAGIEVPEDPTTGFKFNSHKLRFKGVERPNSSYGWDKITRTWMPLCTCEECVREPGKFAFDWRNENWLGNPVYSHHAQNDAECFSLIDKRYMDRLFSRYGGPYCSNNCFCDTCERPQPPWNFRKEDDGKCKTCCKVSDSSDEN